MSESLIDNYTSKYDFIKRPILDEFLEEPKRDKLHYEYISEVYNSPHTFIEFDNYVYWFIDEDNLVKKTLPKE